MEFRRIPDGSSVFRQCVYPVSFKKKAFAREKFLHFADDGNRVITSVSWDRFVPTSELVHEYGCRLAKGRNNKKQAEGKYSEDKKAVYCGSYRLAMSDIRAISDTPGNDGIRSADVIHKVEEGEIAHANLTFCLDPEDLEGTKTLIVDRLWNLSNGPLRHKCECDLNDDPHYSTKLPDGPAGAYEDIRHPLRRYWHIARYRVLNWIWEKVLRKKSVPLPSFL